MFIRDEVQAAVDSRSSIPHDAAIHSPYVFELRPRGFGVHVPNFRVVAERSSFRLRVAVVPDYLAVAVVATVAAGVRNDPETLGRLNAAIVRAGCQPDLCLTDGEFRLVAEKKDILGFEDDEMVDLAVEVGLLLSDFVLAQMVIARPLGETRLAVERPISGDGATDLWLFDPSERDRATMVHRSLENWLIATLADSGLQALDPVGVPFFDVAWTTQSGRRHVCEVKSTAEASEVHQLRLGLGQVIEYRSQLTRAWRSPVQASLLIEREPLDAAWVDVCRDVGVALFWPGNWDQMVPRLLA